MCALCQDSVNKQLKSAHMKTAHRNNPTHKLKATVENPRGSVQKMSPKESVDGADTVLRGIVRAFKGFSQGKPKAAKTRGRSPRGFAAKGLPEENPEGALILTRSSVGTRGTLLSGQLFHSAPRIFNSCSDYQNHEVYWRMKPDG